jgi:formamidase
MSRGPSSVLETCISPVSVLPFHTKNRKNSNDFSIHLEGDGEISFCGAIEMAGTITLNFKVIKQGQAQMGMVNGRSPIYIPGPVQPQFGPSRMIFFEVRPCTSSKFVY